MVCRQKSKKNKLPLFIVGIACIAQGCIRSNAANAPVKKTASVSSTPNQNNSEKTFSSLAISSLQSLNNRTPLGQKINENSLHDVFLTLAICDCLSNLQAKLTTALNETRGTLPQALTPAVRREILNNSKLKILNIIPRPLDEIVGGIFADEQSVSTEINNALREKVSPVEPSWASSPLVPALQLDSFVSLPGTVQQSVGRSVRMVDIWARWALVYSQGGPWNRTRSTRTDAGLLWHELLRSLAEGEYLFGLAGTDEGNKWGGLTLPADLQIKNPGPFDPRVAYNQIRFLTGQLDLQLPSNNSLTLARFGGERWSWRESSVPLSEQTFQWWTSARMLNRLRPQNLNTLSTEVAKVIPNDSYQLSLLALPALSELLRNRFIDQEERSVRALFTGPQSNGISNIIRDKADLQTLSLLLLTMKSWYEELLSTSDLKVSAETLTQLQSAPSSLHRGAQLIVQSILGSHVVSRGDSTSDLPEAPYSLFLDPQNRSLSEMSLRDHAQVLHALVSAEKSFMPSPYLRKRNLQLAAGLVQRWKELSSSQKSQNASLTQYLWLKAVFEQLTSYPQVSVTLSSSLQSLLSESNTWLQNFEESIVQ